MIHKQHDTIFVVHVYVQKFVLGNQPMEMKKKKTKKHQEKDKRASKFEKDCGCVQTSDRDEH